MLSKQAIIFTIIALALVAATLTASTEPDFARVGGAPIGLGLAAAGFAIAAALANRSAR